MPDGSLIMLAGDQSRQAACRLVLAAPQGWLVSIDEPPRTLDQNARYWAACSATAKSDVVWGNERRSKADWGTLFVSGWNIVRHRAVKLTLGLEGELVSLVPHTSRLHVSEFSELLDYQAAWCAMHGVELRE